MSQRKQIWHFMSYVSFTLQHSEAWLCLSHIYTKLPASSSPKPPPWSAPLPQDTSPGGNCCVLIETISCVPYPATVQTVDRVGALWRSPLQLKIQCPNALSSSSLLLAGLLWAFSVGFCSLLWALCFLLVLLFLGPLDTFSPLDAVSPVGPPVVGLAAFTPRALVCGWGSWLRLTPFDNLLVLRDTGSDVGHPSL